MRRLIVMILSCLCGFAASAAPRSEMRDLKALIVQHAGGESDRIEIVQVYDGYTYRIKLTREDGRQNLVIEQTGDSVGYASHENRGGRLVFDSIVITTTFVDENADGFLEDMTESVSKKRYWADHAKKGDEQSRYDTLVKTLIRSLRLNAPI